MDAVPLVLTGFSWLTVTDDLSRAVILIVMQPAQSAHIANRIIAFIPDPPPLPIRSPQLVQLQLTVIELPVCRVEPRDDAAYLPVRFARVFNRMLEVP
jgi:hypothetical protein